MVELDGQKLPMHFRIKQKKLRQIGKIMATPEGNLCRQALVAGENTCNGEELLTE